MTIEPTRRSVLRAGAWTAPVVVVAAAAPALAASPTGSLMFTGGQTRYQIQRDVRASQVFVLWSGAVVTFTGPAIPAGTLRASITSSDPLNHAPEQKPGNNWVPVGNMSNGQATYTWVYSLELSPGTSPSLYNGTRWSLDNSNAPDPTFTVQFSAAGYGSAGSVFSPPN